MGKYTADFETTTDETDCRVWAYGICEIGNVDNFIYGNNIEDFMHFCMGKENHKIYFHNLKFDGEFIIYWLLTNGYTHIIDKKDKKNKTFTTLISNMGQFYSIEVFFKVGNKTVNKVTFYDSLKILNFSVKKIAKAFKLKIQKGEIDYHAKREIGHILTEEELMYLKNDVQIMSYALEEMFKLELTKMTIGSSALAKYKKTITQDRFTRYFPILNFAIDRDIRKTYKRRFYIFKSDLCRKRC